MVREGEEAVSLLVGHEVSAPFTGFDVAFIAQKSIGVFHGNNTDSCFLCDQSFGRQLRAINICPPDNIISELLIKLDICRNAIIDVYDIFHLVIYNSPILIIFISSKLSYTFLIPQKIIQEVITMSENRYELNKNLAQMLKGGVIMDVTTPEQARIAEAAGACAVMALERIPADIRAAGGVSRMSDPKMIKGIQNAVSIPVMAKCRIGHFAEAQILEAIEIDYIDESEVLSPADDKYHIDKTNFKVPFVCGAKDLGEALRRISEGASMIRTKGEPGTGDVVQAVRHMRMMQSEIRRIASLSEDELFEIAKELRVPYELVRFVHENKKLPVVNFAAGGVATPADAALMMQLGAEGVFVGSGIFKSGNPEKRAAAIVKAVTNYADAKLLAELSEDLGEAMVGINEQEIKLLMAQRGE